MFTYNNPATKEAMRAIAELQKVNARADDKSPSRDELIQMGHAIWRDSYKYTEDDHEAFERIIAERGHEQAVPGMSLGSVLLLPNQQIICMGAALWYHQGLHQIVLGHKFCAALLATKVNKEILPDVHPPWRAFLLVLPTKMFYALDTEGKEIEVTRVLVSQMRALSGELRWAYAAFTESSITLWRHGYTTEMLLEDPEYSNYDTELFSEKIEELDRRTCAMLGRLIINTCLAMNDPSNIHKQPKTKWQGWDPNVKGRLSKLPTARTFVLGKNGIIDCRTAVTEYLRTGKKSKGLTVQVLVSGHFRSQPYGTRNTLRKTIWLEPFWRGNEAAPILLKSVELK